MTKPKIFIGIPTMGSIHTNLIHPLIRFAPECLYTTRGIQPVDRARNRIVDEFLSTECEYLFFIDSDTIPPEDALDKLVALDADIAVGIVPIIFETEGGTMIRYNTIGLGETLIKPRTGTQEVELAGAACMLIKREVLVEFIKTEDTVFHYVIGESEVSEDHNFCTKAREKKFTIMCDTSVQCLHSKSTLYR